MSQYSDSLKQKTPDAVLSAMSYVVLKHVMDQSGLINRDQFKASFIFHDRQVLKDKVGVLLTLFILISIVVNGNLAWTDFYAITKYNLSFFPIKETGENPEEN